MIMNTKEIAALWHPRVAARMLPLCRRGLLSIVMAHITAGPGPRRGLLSIVTARITAGLGPRRGRLSIVTAHITAGLGPRRGLLSIVTAHRCHPDSRPSSVIPIEGWCC